MIQCDDCDEWYHGSCVDITPSDALNIDRYRCRDCQQRLQKKPVGGLRGGNQLIFCLFSGRISE